MANWLLCQISSVSLYNQDKQNKTYHTSMGKVMWLSHLVVSFV